MNETFRAKFYSSVAGLLSVFALLITASAQAVTIDFDDLDHNGDPLFYSNPLTNEYQAQGLLIDGGFLMQYSGSDPVVSSPQYLLGGNWLELIFIDTYPTFVSMYVSSPREDVVSLTAVGASGSTIVKKTSGWGGPHNDTPYVPRQLVTFTLGEGVTKIGIESFYFRNTSAMIDDLVFEKKAVPESSSLALLLAGLFAIAVRKRKFKNKAS